jgi:hypothetical protein
MSGAMPLFEGMIDHELAGAIRPRNQKLHVMTEVIMDFPRRPTVLGKRFSGLAGICFALSLSPFATPASAQAQPQPAAPAAKPNILFIMGDDIGWMQPSIYHQGLMVGETPNIDRIGQEGARFTDYYAEQSCTAGRNAFFTGMHPLRTGITLMRCKG